MSFIANSAVVMQTCEIGDNVTIEEGVFIDHHCVIKDHVTIKKNSRIGAQCILGECGHIENKCASINPLVIGENALVRSGTVIYGGSEVGSFFQTGHHVTIREQVIIGHHVSIGTSSDVQNCCSIGNYARLHSNVFLGQESIIEDFALLFPYVVLTNDPTPPSNDFIGAKVESYAVISAGTILLPGVTVGRDALVGAGAIVTKSVPPGMLAIGQPAKVMGPVEKVKNRVTGERAYPWRYTFSRGMPWEQEGIQAWEQRRQNKQDA